MAEAILCFLFVFWNVQVRVRPIATLPSDYDYATVALRHDWPHHLLTKPMSDTTTDPMTQMTDLMPVSMTAQNCDIRWMRWIRCPIICSFLILTFAGRQNQSRQVGGRWLSWPSVHSTKMGESSRSTFIRWTCSIFRRQFWIADLQLIILISIRAPSGSLRANVNILKVMFGQKCLTFELQIKYLICVYGWKLLWLRAWFDTSCL